MFTCSKRVFISLVSCTLQILHDALLMQMELCEHPVSWNKHRSRNRLWSDIEFLRARVTVRVWVFKDCSHSPKFFITGVRVELQQKMNQRACWQTHDQMHTSCYHMVKTNLQQTQYQLLSAVMDDEYQESASVHTGTSVNYSLHLTTTTQTAHVHSKNHWRQLHKSQSIWRHSDASSSHIFHVTKCSFLPIFRQMQVFLLSLKAEFQSYKMTSITLMDTYSVQNIMKFSDHSFL